MNASNQAVQPIDEMLLERHSNYGEQTMSPLLELARYGQSYWLDDLSRPMIESGELQRRVTIDHRQELTE